MRHLYQWLSCFKDATYCTGNCCDLPNYSKLSPATFYVIQFLPRSLHTSDWRHFEHSVLVPCEAKAV